MSFNIAALTWDMQNGGALGTSMIPYEKLSKQEQALAGQENAAGDVATTDYYPSQASLPSTSSDTKKASIST